MLASASDDKTVRLWDADTGELLKTLEGHSSSVNAVQFSQDGKRLASASDDKIVRLWNPCMGNTIQVIDLGGLESYPAFAADVFFRHTSNIGFEYVPAPSRHSDDSAFSVCSRLRTDWILQNNRRWVWLPPEQRPSRNLVAIHGGIIAFGTQSGGVTFWTTSK